MTIKIINVLNNDELLQVCTNKECRSVLLYNLEDINRMFTPNPSPFITFNKSTANTSTNIVNTLICPNCKSVIPIGGKYSL